MDANNTNGHEQCGILPLPLRGRGQGTIITAPHQPLAPLSFRGRGQETIITAPHQPLAPSPLGGEARGLSSPHLINRWPPSPLGGEARGLSSPHLINRWPPSPLGGEARGLSSPHLINRWPPSPFGGGARGGGKRGRLGKLLLLTLLLTLTACGTAPLPAATVTPKFSPPADVPAPSPARSPSPSPTATAYRRVLTLGNGAPETLAWSPDGDALAVATAAGVLLYAGDPLTETARLASGLWVSALAWSPDGFSLAWGEPTGNVVLWDVPSAAPRARLEGNAAAVTALAFAPDGKTLSVGRADSTLTLWEPRTGETSAPLRGHTDRLTGLVFCGTLPDVETPALFSASRDGSLTLWDAVRGKLRFTLRVAGAPLRALSCDAVRGWVYSADTDGLIQAWGPQGQILRYAAEAGSFPAALSVAAQGWLAAGDENGLLTLWDGESGAPLRRIRAHAEAVLALAYRPGSDMLASLGADGALRLWNGAPQVNRETETPAPSLTVGGFASGVRDALLWPEGALLASAHADGGVRLWPLRDGRLRAAWSAHRGAATALVLDPQGGALLSTGLDGAIRRWHLPDGAPAGTRYTQSPLTAARFAGGLLAVAGTDGKVQVWQGETLAAETTLPAGDWGAALAFQPPATLWVLSRAGALRGYRLPALEPLSDPGGEFPGGEALTCAADCRRFAVLDGQGGVWTGAPGAWEQLPLPQGGRATAVWLSPDGETLLAGMQTGEVWAVSAEGVRRLFTEDSAPLWLFRSGETVYCGLRSGLITAWEMPESR